MTEQVQEVGQSDKYVTYNNGHYDRKVTEHHLTFPYVLYGVLKKN